MSKFFSSIFSVLLISSFMLGPSTLFAQSYSDEGKKQEKRTYKKARVLTSKTAKKVVKVVEALERQKVVKVPDPENKGKFIEKEEDDPDWDEAKRILTELLSERGDLKSYDRSVMWNYWGYIYFSEEDYEVKGAIIKCNPAIKKATDRQALLQAVRDDVIDVVATDHAPHTWDEKQNSYFKAPAGLPLVQHALISMLEHHHRGLLSLEQIVQKTSHNVAELFQIAERGYIREGYWADLVLVDLDAPTVVDEQKLYSKCGWSPFSGYIFKSSIVATLVNGEMAFENGEVNPNIRGKRIAFNR